jgi:hypothetical protein
MARTEQLPTRKLNFEDEYGRRGGSPMRQPSPRRSSPIRPAFSPQRTTASRGYDMTPTQKGSSYGRTNLGRSANKNDVTRHLMQGSSAKKDRMKYADPNDHSFNASDRFVNRKTSPYLIVDKKNERQMPPVRQHLPRVSPISNDIEDELITVFKDMMQHERELEDAKVALT